MRGINGDNICECVYEKEKGGQRGGEEERGGEKGEGEKDRERDGKYVRCVSS